MNRNIPKLLRLRYALNMINSIKAISRKNSKNSEQMCEEYRNELKLPLTETTPDGKLKAKNGKYLGRIFDDIFEKTGWEIKELNTRKRIMGIHSDLATYNPSEDYREAITKYLEYSPWEKLEKDAESLVSKLEKEVFGESAKGTMIGTQRPAEGMFFPTDYNEREVIEMHLEDGCYLRLLCQGSCKFMVTRVKGLSLEPKDILFISSVLQRGGNLYADEISRERKVLGSYMGSHPIIDFSTVREESSTDDIFRKAAEMLKGM